MSGQMEEFWACVEKHPGGCWLWTGGTSSEGRYGAFKGRPAHRVSYEFMVGPVRPRFELDHLCHRGLCVNPDHLDHVTHKQNMERAVWSNRADECPQGHPLKGDNLYVPPGHPRRRECKECRRANVRRWRERAR